MTPEPARDCRVTLLTPQGRGAIATIAVQGARAEELVDQRFQPASGQPVTAIPIDRIAFGRWVHADACSEDVVVCRRGRNSIEVSCHGGQTAAAAIMESLFAVGAATGEPAVWVAGGHSDRLAAEAFLDLQESQTTRTAAILLDQYRGALRQTVSDIVARLKRNDLTASDELDRLAALGPIGLHLTRAWRVAVTGVPNVGKSSLVNAILGYQRCIVIDQPGTTRDAVVTQTALDGWLFDLVDTAGLRTSSDPVESAGVELAQTEIATADLVVTVVDARDASADLASDVVAGGPLVVRNKCDLLAGTAEGRAAGDAVRVSAATGFGIELLVKAIVERLAVPPPRPGEGVPFRQRHVGVIDDAQKELRRPDTGAAARRLESLL